MKVLLLISFVLFVAYTFTATLDYSLTNRKLSIPESLSSTFYLLEGHQHGMGYTFTLMMFLCAFTIIAPWIEATTDTFTFVPFIGTVGIGFVGAAPTYKDGSMVKTIHETGAFVAALFAMYWGIVIVGAFKVWIVVAIILLALAICSKSVIKSRIFWAECICFFGTYFTLLTLYI